MSAKAKEIEKEDTIAINGRTKFGPLMDTETEDHARLQGGNGPRKRRKKLREH